MMMIFLLPIWEPSMEKTVSSFLKSRLASLKGPKSGTTRSTPSRHSKVPPSTALLSPTTPTMVRILPRETWAINPRASTLVSPRATWPSLASFFMTTTIFFSSNKKRCGALAPHLFISLYD